MSEITVQDRFVGGKNPCLSSSYSRQQKKYKKRGEAGRDDRKRGRFKKYQSAELGEGRVEEENSSSFKKLIGIIGSRGEVQQGFTLSKKKAPVCVP